MTNNAARSRQGAALSVTIIPDCLCSLQPPSHFLPHLFLPSSYGNKHKLSTNKHKHCHCGAQTVKQKHPFLPSPCYDQDQQMAVFLQPPACVCVVVPLSVDHTVFRGGPTMSPGLSRILFILVLILKN